VALTGSPSRTRRKVTFSLHRYSLKMGPGSLVSLAPLIAQVDFDRREAPRIVALVTAASPMEKAGFEVRTRLPAGERWILSVRLAG
jgi:hypothetical protein